MPTTATLEIQGRSIKIPTQLYIDGKWVDAVGGNKFDVEDPGTAKTIVSISEGREEDIDLAVKAARKAFKPWSKTDAKYRAALLFKVADLLEARKDDVTYVEVLDTGKTLKSAQAIDLNAAVATFRWFAGWADKITGETHTLPGMHAYTKKEPIGVCGQITPWNFPLLMNAWKTAPCLAVGSTLVLKTAETTPLSALMLFDIFDEVGFPPGVANLVSGYGKTAGAALASHMDVDKVAFTGSTITGRNILKAAASSNLKKVTLELGGKSPAIVFEDADIEETARWLSFGINLHMGQVCHASSRILVQDSIHDKFIEAFAKEMKKRTIGDQWSGADGGPQNSKMQHEKILSYIESAKEDGAELVLGGGKGEGPGYLIQPTIFKNVETSHKIWKEEIFGPVVAVTKFSTEEEAIELANLTTYGLAAGVFTKDLQRSVRVSEEMRAGTVWVNCFNMLTGTLPFGGYKESGIGRECGEAALQNYLETKSVYVNMGLEVPPL